MLRKGRKDRRDLSAVPGKGVAGPMCEAPHAEVQADGRGGRQLVAQVFGVDG